MKHCCIEVLIWLTTEGEGTTVDTVGVVIEGGSLAIPLLPIAIGVGGAFHIANALWQGYQGQQRINEVNDYVQKLENKGISVAYPRMRGLYTDEVGNWLGAFAGVAYGSSSVFGAYSSYKAGLGYSGDTSFNPYENGYW